MRSRRGSSDHPPIPADRSRWSTDSRRQAMTDVDAEPAPRPPNGTARHESRVARARRQIATWSSEQWALATFIGYVVVAFPVVLFGLGAYHWFFRDDWFFIAGRDGRSLNDLFRDH